ncbi:hypothetical protein D3C76_1221930 [compost metagenome]
MQLLPALAQTPDAKAIRSDSQRQQATESQGANKDVWPLAQVDQKLLHIQTKEEHGVSADMHDHIGKAPEPQLTAHCNPSPPASQLLQWRHRQRDQQEPERPKPQPVDQYLSRIRPQGEYPGLV